jgi:putative ABC transport system permease protein
MWRTQQGLTKSGVAIARMLLQLLFIGYFLLFIFANQSAFLTISLLLVMTLIATWIALNVTSNISISLYLKALCALLIGGFSMLIFITQCVLEVSPWYNPRFILPLAGMIFASSMTAISLSLERFESELVHNNVEISLNKAFNAATIPVVNSMLAVGIVSLPGMMTGQILSGVEPYIAARYQIMVMTMIFSSTGITVFIFLKLLANSKRSELSAL